MAVKRLGPRRTWYFGASTDVKPTTGVVVGSKFYETNTLKTYIFLGGTTWVEVTK